MNQEKIAILDIDGVVLDIIPGLIKYIKEKYKVSITAADITTYDWGYCLGLPEGTNNDELWNYIWNVPGVPYFKAIEFIQQLKALGYFVQGLSTRISPNSIIAANRDFPQLQLDAWALSKDKAEWILKNMPTAKFIVEDHNNNAIQIGTRTELTVYLFNRPWNRNCKSITKVWQRIYNYLDILSYIKENEAI